MSRKSDLEENIRESYKLVKSYEEIQRLSSDPKEKGRVSLTINEQKYLIYGYFKEYLKLCQAMGYSMPQDIREISVTVGNEQIESNTNAAMPGHPIGISSTPANIPLSQKYLKDRQNGIPSTVIGELRKVLMECDEFVNQQALLALFVIPELRTFKSSLPEATAIGERVDRTINYLWDKQLVSGENGLVILLEEIRDRIPSEDSRHVRLADVVEKLKMPIKLQRGTSDDIGLSNRDVEKYQNSNKLISTLLGHTYHINTLSLSADGQFLASGAGDKEAITWHLSTGQKTAILRQDNWVGAVAFDPLGRYLATSGGKGDLYLWGLKNYQLAIKLSNHQGDCRALAFDPQGTWLASGGADHKINIWALPEITLVSSLTAHQGEVRCLACSPDGKYLIAGDDRGSLRLWSIENASSFELAQYPITTIRSVAYTVNSQYIAFTDSNGRVGVWDIQQRIHRWNAQGHQGHAIGVAIHPAGDLVASGGQDGLIRLWDARNGKLLGDIQGHEKEVTCLVFANDGNWLISGSRDQAIRIWKS